jgi:uncharacterized protein (TIGR03085 family)
MTDPARAERSELCDLALAVGPEQPTLCEGWDVRDLLAHLVVRERRPAAALGILLRPLAAYGERVRVATSRQPFAQLVEVVRDGPPRWSPMALAPIDRLANTVEFFVHHEDVRRARAGWEPRTLTPELDDALAARLRPMSRLLARRAPCGVQVALTGRQPFLAKRGDDLVTVAGTPGEVTLFLYGRQAHARVDLVGPPAAATVLGTAELGL